MGIYNNHEARFWSYVEVIDGHWIWTGPKTRSRDTAPFYGYFEIKGRNVKAHRFSYKLKHGELDDELVLDHVAERCQNTLCVNPDCLEPVTAKENTRRYYDGKTHCINNHEYTPANTYIRRDNNTRQCRQCRRERRALQR